jgi:hypothetical protein
MPALPFSDVLDAAQRDAADIGEARQAAQPLWFPPLFENGVPSYGRGGPPLQRARRYAGDAHAVLADAAAIARDLGVDASSSRCELAEARRRFAVRNHPDRAPAQLQELATARMAIANELIDRWLASK